MTNRHLLNTLIILLFPIILFAQENTALSCSDGIDNDGDGLIDCLDGDCGNLPNNGCAICTDGISFADTLLEYTPGCPLSDPDPEGALGVSDWTGVQVDEPQLVFLGQGGILKLGFTNNLLTNSGDNQEDLWVFEVGPAVESSDLALRPADAFTELQLQLLAIPDINADGYYEMGNISGATAGLDIDAVLPGFLPGALAFDAIEIKDVIDGSCGGGTPGADIDAVCALFSARADCAGILNGTAVVDDCGVCLEPTDPDFNQSCIDCAGTANGAAVIDDCGVCLEPTDPSFNQSCADCAGTPNGTAVVDNCDVCLEPTDPNFNQSCTDCTGVLNGTAVVDDCGICLEPTDPSFNQSCTDCAGTTNGTAAVDDCGICLEPTDPNFNQSCADCAGTINGTAVVDNCGQCLESNDPIFNLSCIKDVFVPNVFSPNNDGVNDVFQLYKKPEAIAQINTYMIFSRWGDLLYQANNFQFSDRSKWWNGQFKGDKMDVGIYVYYIEVLFQDGMISKYEGNISLIR